MLIAEAADARNLMLVRSRLICVMVAIVLLACGRVESQSKPKMDNLIVYGEGFSFAVKEPDGWRADTGEIASQYHVNVIFSPLQEASLKHNVSIRVRVSKKQDENTIEDLNYDMQQYKKQFPAAQFSDLTITHPEYKTFARRVFLPDKFHEYVAYLNPGPGKPFVFSVAMSRQDAPATEDELRAYELVLKSVQWMTSSAIVK